MTERPAILPFAIDLRDSASMTEQVVVGLRRAIQSGPLFVCFGGLSAANCDIIYDSTKE